MSLSSTQLRFGKSIRKKGRLETIQHLETSIFKSKYKKNYVQIQCVLAINLTIIS